jgi:hypothetical protein
MLICPATGLTQASVTKVKGTLISPAVHARLMEIETGQRFVCCHGALRL